MGSSAHPDVTPGLNNNALFSEGTVDKLSVTVNLRSPRGLDLVKRLVGISDLVIENFSAGMLARRGLSYETLQSLKSDIVYVSMAGLGQTGRYHEYKTFGPVVQALSGLTQLNGLPDIEPALWRWAYMDDTGGMYGALCALAALHHRNLTGVGQHVDLAQVSAGMPLTGAAWLDYTVNGRSSRRDGFPAGNRTVQPGTPPANNYRGPTTAPHNSYRTAPRGVDQYPWCVIACYGEAQWNRLVHVMGCPAWTDDPKFGTLLGRLTHQIELDQLIEQWTLTLGKYEVLQVCQAAGVPAMPVQDARDRVVNDVQLQARGWLQELPHPEIGPLRYQCLPFVGSAMDLAPRTAGPLAGQHNVDILCDLLGESRDSLREGYTDGTFWPKSLPLEAYLEEQISDAHLGDVVPEAGSTTIDAARPTAPDAGSASLPSSAIYAGLRVIELGGVRGQWVGKLLADLGADVIKVEPRGGCEERFVGPFYHDDPHPDRSLSFWHHNTSKRGVTLDLTLAEGRDILRRLAGSADVLIDGFSPGYLAAQGLDHADLLRRNKRLIVCAITDFGLTGPWRDYVVSDIGHLAAGGQMAACGYDAQVAADAPPIALGGGQSWYIGGHYAMIAIGAAICQRDTTGQGQCLDVSIHEACALTTEGHINRYIANPDGLPNQRRGQSKSQFRCKDGVYLNSQWSSEMTPEHLAVLAYWLDEYEMAGDLLDDRYADPGVIAESTAHIGDLLEAFFASIDSEEAYQGAQARGFAFGPVRTTQDILEDGHWQDRGFFVSLPHPELGESFVYPGAYALFSATPLVLSRRAPTLGEHNREVFCELGISDLELSVLTEPAQSDRVDFA